MVWSLTVVWSIMKFWGAASQMNVQDRLRCLSQLPGTRLLIVYGEKDELIDPGVARRLNGHWPNIRVIGLPASKHFPMLDESARFNRLLQDFLQVDQDLAGLELKQEWRRRTR